MQRKERTSPIYTPASGPPQVARPSSEILEKMGEEGVFRMLGDLYRKLEHSTIRGMFPEDMELASRKSAAFFVQLLGGRPRYNEVYGQPRMTQRHLPFDIDGGAKGVWLQCFAEVLAEAESAYGFPPEHLPGFRAFLDSFSAWMVNKAEDQNL